MRLRGVTYPDQTRFAFRSGVTCLITPAGAVLLNPPRSEKLTRLSAGRLQALKALNLGPATVSELSTTAADDVGTLISELAAGGWLTVTVRDGGKDLYAIVPCGQPPPRPAPPAASSVVLSKFAVLHRDSEGIVLEHPLSWCDVRIHDARLLALLDGSTSTDVPSAVATQFVEDLLWSGMLVAAGPDNPRIRASSPSAGARRICGSTAAAPSESATSPGSTSAPPSGPRAGSPSLRRVRRVMPKNRSPWPFPTWRKSGRKTLP